MSIARADSECTMVSKTHSSSELQRALSHVLLDASGKLKLPDNLDDLEAWVWIVGVWFSQFFKTFCKACFHMKHKPAYKSHVYTWYQLSWWLWFRRLWNVNLLTLMPRDRRPDLLPLLYRLLLVQLYHTWVNGIEIVTHILNRTNIFSSTWVLNPFCVHLRLDVVVQVAPSMLRLKLCSCLCLALRWSHDIRYPPCPWFVWTMHICMWHYVPNGWIHSIFFGGVWDCFRVKQAIVFSSVTVTFNCQFKKSDWLDSSCW